MRLCSIKESTVQDVAYQAAEALKAGGIVLYPTDTLYGLAVDATNTDAVKRLNELKGRGGDKFTSVVVRDKDMIERYAAVPEQAKKLIEDFLPGPLTIALPARGEDLKHLSVDHTVRFRIPNDSFVMALAKEVGFPFTSTSANVSGEPPLSTVEEILAQFGERANEINLAVDDGPRLGGKPSTVVRVVEGDPEIVREGALSKSELGL